MFQYFTDRSRKVLQLANSEAARLNHDHIATQHILIGLLKEGQGVAANTLINLGLDPEKTFQDFESRSPPGTEKASSTGLPMTPRVKQFIQDSLDEAKQLGHNYVGTEHLLLSLLRQKEGSACELIQNQGLQLDEIRQEVLNVLGHFE